MTVWGDGSDVRDFIHVDDLVKFVDVALKNKKQKFELYNVGGDEHITIADLVRSIIRLSGKNIEIQFDTSMPSIGTKVWLDISKAKNAFSWKPAIKLEEGIQKTIHWYRDYFKTELKNIDRTVDRTL
jgi:nucleoside-diphosphate-sugar epimerase